MASTYKVGPLGNSTFCEEFYTGGVVDPRQGITLYLSELRKELREPNGEFSVSLQAPPYVSECSE